MTDPGLDIFDLALACYRTPLAHQNRMGLAAPLPRDMNRLLWLANGSPETLGDAVRQTGSKAEELRDAARFLVGHAVISVDTPAPLRLARYIAVSARRQRACRCSPGT